MTPGGGGPPWGEVATGPARDVLDLLGDADDLAPDLEDGLSPSARPTTAAWRRYDGVVHRSVDPGTLTDADRRRFRRHVAYVSALGGLVRATDPLPAYRLEMATVVGDVGGLGPWWRPHVTATLDESLAPGALLWLLTGGEYGRAVDAPEGTTLVEPAFLRADTDRSMPSATVKQCRGGLARALCEHPDLARRPLDERWRDVELLAAGTPVRFEGAAPDGSPVWRAAA